ncbi:MAG: hypothetical protein QOJ19_266 [Acidimicrobiia bacterium]|nr:hypothetical protein [Acidimicrobiia bacterium]
MLSPRMGYHSIFTSELLQLSSEYEAKRLIRQLLEKVSGGSFGLPQLYEPSYWLS